MENVTALENAEVIFVYLADTNWALPSLALDFFCFPFVLYSLFFQKLFEGQFVLSVLFIDFCLLLPFLLDVSLIYHCLLNAETHDFNHSTFFVCNATQIFPECFDWIYNYKADGVSF